MYMVSNYSNFCYKFIKHILEFGTSPSCNKTPIRELLQTLIEIVDCVEHEALAAQSRAND